MTARTPPASPHVPAAKHYPPQPDVYHFESPVIRKYQELLEPFFEKAYAQEKELVAVGYDPEGPTDFLKLYMHSWDQDGDNPYHHERPLFCVTEDMQFTLSALFKTRFRSARTGWSKSPLMKVSNWMLYTVARELLFAPINEKHTALPYYDFFGGIVRCTLPWAIPVEPRLARWIPAFLRIGPLRRTWIDTDWDFSQALTQLLPIPTPT
jgi:hypothetical protein